MLGKTDFEMLQEILHELRMIRKIMEERWDK